MAAAAFSRPMAGLLMAHGADCRARNRRGAEPLHYAADGGRREPRAQADVIEYLISMGAVDFGILVDGAVVLAENVLHEASAQKPKRRRDLLGLIVRSAIDVARPTFFAMAIIIAALIPVFTLQRV